MPWARGAGGGAFARLRSSMTAQIAWAITLVSVLLVAGSSWYVVRLVRDELRDGADLVLLTSLAILRDRLHAAGYEAQVFAEQMGGRDHLEVQLGSLHLALLDDARRVLATTDSFEVPISALPARALDAEVLPAQVSHETVRALQGPLAEATLNWSAPGGGRQYRVLLVSLPVADAAGAARAPLLAVLALEMTQSREVVVRGSSIVFVTLVASALAASLLGMMIARRIVVVARKLGSTASRIGANALGERIPLEGAPRELAESARAFNLMLDRLEDSFERLSQFSSDLAHDLRTPINNLLGEAQVALSRPRCADEYRQVIESSVEEYERISRLIGDMLFLARAEDPHAQIQREWVDMEAASERLHEYFLPVAEERGVTLMKHCRSQTGNAPRVWADRVLLVRAIGNLLSNALRYAPRGSAVDVSATVAADGSCTIEVANDGPPIPPEARERIFDRLYRIDPARHGSASGAGLGLAIVKSIMDMHRGEVGVASGEGRRTVFSLRFPAPAD